MKNLACLIALIAFVLLGNGERCSANQTDTVTFYKSINVKRANRLNEENKGNPQFVVLDVRSANDYSNDHLANAINIDFKSDDFVEKLKQLDRSKTYLVICYGGVRSKKTMAQMKALRFTKVYNVKGGMLKWRAKGLPLVKE
jgi:rhodanese-related sulfurtransferase